MSKRLMLVMAVVCVILAGSEDGRGQSFTFWGEAGAQQTELGNKATQTRTFDLKNLNEFAYGLGFSGIIGGTAKKNTAFLVPVGVEFRSDSKNEFSDLVVYADFATRIKNVSFGPGFNFSWIGRADALDPTCTTAAVTAYERPDGVASRKSSCVTLLDRDGEGRREIGDFLGFGISGFGKINFGPQGRAFVQSRYIYYHRDWISNLSGAEVLNLIGGGALFDAPTDFPTFRKGRDVRVSAGYVFGRGESIAKIVRAQYTDRQFDFQKEGANVTGVFNQKTRQLTFGFGIVF